MTECECREWARDQPPAGLIACEVRAIAYVMVEYVPRHLRPFLSLEGGRGAYPANGAMRIRVTTACARVILEAEPEWTRLVP